MKKAELIEALQKTSLATSGKQFTKAQVDTLLESLKLVAASELKQNQVFEIHGFLKLEVKDYAKRNGHNPVTGEQMEVAARRKIKAKAFKKFSDEVGL